MPQLSAVAAELLCPEPESAPAVRAPPVVAIATNSSSTTATAASAAAAQQPDGRHLQVRAVSCWSILLLYGLANEPMAGTFGTHGDQG